MTKKSQNRHQNVRWHFTKNQSKWRNCVCVC